MILQWNGWNYTDTIGQSIIHKINIKLFEFTNILNKSVIWEAKQFAKIWDKYIKLSLKN